MSRLLHWSIVLAMLVGIPHGITQQVQMPAGISDKVPFLAAALSEFISDSRSFVAKAELRVPTPGGEPMMLPFDVAMRNGKMRWDLNLLKAESVIPPESTEIVRQFGLDRIVLLMAPNQKLIVAFPTLKSYLEQAPPKDQGIEDQAVKKLGRLVKTRVGKEVIDGHACTKFRLSDPKDESGREVAMVWQADDLKDFPVKLLVRVQDETYDFRFRNVRLGEPEERAFAPPAGYTKFESADGLMASLVAKSLGVENELKGLPGSP